MNVGRIVTRCVEMAALTLVAGCVGVRPVGGPSGTSPRPAATSPATTEASEVPQMPTMPERPPGGPGATRPLPAAPVAKTPPAPAAPPIGRPRKAMEAKALDVAFRCAARDERNYTVQADVEVRQAQVRYLRMRLVTPEGGTCEFDLPDFIQTRAMPLVELQARSGRCTLRMWEQGPQVTVAYSDCKQYCKPGASFEEMLPTLYDRRVDRCN